jgi:hypothetical protein
VAKAPWNVQIRLSFQFPQVHCGAKVSQFPPRGGNDFGQGRHAGFIDYKGNQQSGLSSLHLARSIFAQ